MRAKYLVGHTLGQLVQWAETYAPDQTQRFKRHFYRPDMRFALRLLRETGFRPRVAIDIGAYHGGWADDCLREFPSTEILMIEPGPERVVALKRICERDPRRQVAQSLLSSSAATVLFKEQETNSGIATAVEPNVSPMPTTTLDQLVAGTRFSRPDLLKVDVQGYDIEVLKGGTQALASVEVVIIELSLIPLSPAAPSMRQAIDWMDDHGFRLLDFAGFIRRPVDDALWQVDAVFARHDSSLGAVARGW